MMDEKCNADTSPEPKGAHGECNAPVRGEVAWFAGQMEAKLRANDHKMHWRHLDACDLFDRLRQEVDELSHCCIDQPDRVIAEAADVANFAMMLADKARKYASPTPQREDSDDHRG